MVARHWVLEEDAKSSIELLQAGCCLLFLVLMGPQGVSAAGQTSTAIIRCLWKTELCTWMAASYNQLAMRGADVSEAYQPSLSGEFCK